MQKDNQYFSLAASAMLLVLAACGGGSSTGGDAVPDTAPPGGSTPPAGSTPPDTGPSGSLLFPNALAPTQDERAEMFSWARDTVPLFEAANALPAVLPPPGSANFDGNMLARMGSGEEFIHGTLDLTVNFDTGNGNGTLGFMAVSGADTVNRQLDQLSSYDVVLTGATDQTFGGTITGTVDDADFLNIVPDDDSFTLDTTIDGRFVGTQSVPSMVGTVTGTVTSNAGTRPLDGIIVTERGLAPNF